MLSASLAAYVVSRLPAGQLTLVIDSPSTVLSGYTLVRALL